MLQFYILRKAILIPEIRQIYIYFMPAVVFQIFLIISRCSQIICLLYALGFFWFQTIDNPTFNRARSQPLVKWFLVMLWKICLFVSQKLMKCLHMIPCFGSKAYKWTVGLQMMIFSTTKPTVMVSFGLFCPTNHPKPKDTQLI